MKADNQPPDDTDQPVAYDVEGRPLYYRPVAEPAQPQVVHMARPTSPEKMSISPKVKLRHERSVALYPTLNLSEGEYVIMVVRRHSIGLIAMVAAGALLMLFPLIALFNYGLIVEVLGLTGNLANLSTVILPILMFLLLVNLGMYVSYYVYTNNRFYLTNESVIQQIQLSLFSRHEQTVSLANIEDASFTQRGLIQQLFNFGTVRLSTEGEETTYRFTYVAGPREHIERLNNAVEAFKNGRPVDED